MLAACWLNCSMIETEPACRSPLCLMLLAHAPIWFAVSASSPCNVSVRRRAASARSRAWSERRGSGRGDGERLLRGAGGFLGAAGDLFHRPAQLLGGRRRFGDSACKLLARRRDALFDLLLAAGSPTARQAFALSPVGGAAPRATGRAQRGLTPFLSWRGRTFS